MQVESTWRKLRHFMRRMGITYQKKHVVSWAFASSFLMDHKSLGEIGAAVRDHMTSRMETDRVGVRDIWKATDAEASEDSDSDSAAEDEGASDTSGSDSD